MVHEAISTIRNVLKVNEILFFKNFEKKTIKMISCKVNLSIKRKFLRLKFDTSNTY